MKKKQYLCSGFTNLQYISVKILYISILSILLLCPAATNQPEEYVYICTGNYSKCYHKSDKCEGLTYCGGEIKKVSKTDAINKYNRKACKYCYSK